MQVMHPQPTVCGARMYTLKLACFSAPHVLKTYAVVLEDYVASGQQTLVTQVLPHCVASIT